MDMQTGFDAERMVTLSPDGQAVRLHLPPVALAGLAEPLRLHVDFDRQGLDELVGRLQRLSRELAA